jgi:DNA-binding NarL/FixJ family response regulator
VESIAAQGAGTSARLPEYLEWGLLAREYANPDSIERAFADTVLAAAWNARGRLQEARALRLEALALSRRLNDPEMLSRAAFYLLLQGGPQQWDERLKLAEECIEWPRAGVSSRSLGPLLWYAARQLLAHGERGRAEEVWRQVADLGERTHVASVTLLVARRDIVLAIVDGDLEEALASMGRFIARGDGSGAAVGSRQFTLSMLLAPAIYLGQMEVWLAVFDEFAELAGDASQAIDFGDARAVCLAHLGRLDEARAAVGSHLEQIARGVDDSETHMFTLVWLLEAAVLLEDRRAARALSERLACVAHLSIGEGFYTCPARHLGDAASLLGDSLAAAAYYRVALEAAEKIRFRPEAALARLRLAELLLEEETDDARLEALQHLDLAIPELRDMHMHASLQRASSLVENDARLSRNASANRQSTPDALTPREREIANLMATGMSNREIGAQLVISEGTVEVHVKHILSKLQFRSRTQVAGWVAQQPPELT